MIHASTRRTVLRILVLALAGAPPLAAQVAAPAANGDAVTAEWLKERVSWLADDARAGRDTGSPGSVAAARWLAQQLAAAGAQPTPGAEDFLQKVPMQRTRYEGVPELTATTNSGEAIHAVYGVDFDLADVARSTAKLRVVRVLSEAYMPSKPEADVALYFSGSRSMRRMLLDKAHTPRGEGWGAILTEGPEAVGPKAITEMPESGARLAQSGTQPAPSLRLRGPLRARFLAGEIATIEIAVKARVEDVEAYNVVGWIRGAGDSARGVAAGSAIVVSAHYDHLGVKSRVEPVQALGPGDGPAGPDVEDVIFNGADDDASGCAAVLALARTFGQGPPPARTLVFLLATGEEIGLVGTKWYIEHPSVPLADTVLNLNFEMIGRPDPLVGGPGILWLTGFERSNLGEQWRAHDLAIESDKRPDQQFFQRSDNYAFALEGVVAQTLSSYNLHEDYHRVDDEADRLDYAHMETAVRTATAALKLVADGELTPAWSADGKPKKR